MRHQEAREARELHEAHVELPGCEGLVAKQGRQHPEPAPARVTYQIHRRVWPAIVERLALEEASAQAEGDLGARGELA